MSDLLVHNTEILSNHSELNFDFEFENIKPFVYRTEKNWLVKFISKEQYKVLVDYTGSDSIILEVISHLESCITHFALMRSMVRLKNQFGNSGPKEENNREWWRDRDLLRSYRNTAMESLDMALKSMRVSLDLFPEYRDSKEYEQFKTLIIQSPEDFSEFVFIHDSMVTFLAIVPVMRFIQISEFTTLDESVFMNPSSDLQRKAVHKLKGIIAHRTKSQLLLSNQFTFDDLGFSFKIELLPWEYKLKADKEFLDKQISNELAKANVYRDQLYKLLDSNPEEFNIESPKTVNFISKQNSSLGLL